MDDLLVQGAPVMVDADEPLPADGLLLLPGAVNAHARPAMSLMRGVAEDLPIECWCNQVIWPLEANLTEERVYWGMLLGRLESLRSGVPPPADHSFFEDAAAVEQSEIRALPAPTRFCGPQEAVDLTRSRDGART